MLTFGPRSFTWEHGRQLESQTMNGVTWTYSYDFDGMRTGRTNGTTSYEYIYNGSQLMRMIRNGVVVDFTYINGIPATISFGGNTFYYVVNGQGDVTGITDSQGNLQITYYYDAWGSVYCTYDSTISPYAQSLYDLNPLMYRGYVFDREVGMYYLQSRYYIPEIGRFLSADVYISTGQGFIGSNMYAYCNNAAVNAFDPTGEDAIWLQDSDNVGGLGHTGLLIQYSKNKWYHFYWGANREGSKGKSGKGDIVLEYEGKLTLSEINKFYSANHDGAEYEYMIYLKGKFTDSYYYAEKIKENYYNLIWYNCMQVSTDVLRKGRFLTNDKEYDYFLSRIRNATIPNNAFARFVLFHATVRKWNSAPRYKRWFLTNPWKAAIMI